MSSKAGAGGASGHRWARFSLRCSSSVAPAVVTVAVGLLASTSIAMAQPAARSTKDDQVIRSAGLQIIDRTFFAASEGNLRGTIYFGRSRQAVQVAPERGTRRLKWGILAQVEGIKGPAICLIGEYTDISPGRSAVVVQKGGTAATCTAVSTFVRIKNSRGNGLGLGTIIQ